jgi:hypothetical protein
MTIERPMFPPADPTRRHFLNLAAGASVTVAAMPAVAPAIAACTVDPAFALIAAYRAAEVALGKAIDAEEEADTKHGRGSDEAWEAAERSEAVCHALQATCWKLANTPPITLAGVAAVLRLTNELEDKGGEWPSTDTVGAEGWHYQLRATMAAAVEALIEAGKAVLS